MIDFFFLIINTQVTIYCMVYLGLGLYYGILKIWCNETSGGILNSTFIFNPLKLWILLTVTT